ncbi:unnamed protein product, partial [Staurois parvus]
SCCCQVQSVSWVPVRPPIAAGLHRHTLPCATFRSPHTAGGFPFCHRVLADYGPPIAAARPRNLSWAPVPPPHAAARSRVCHGSLYGLPLLLSPSPHSAMCHFQVSSHCWWVPFC